MKSKMRLKLLHKMIPLLVIVCAAAFIPARQTNAQNFPKRLGLALTEASAYRSIAVNPTPLTRTLPPAVDLSANMPPVGDQGSQDSCVGWSTAYAARTYLERVLLKGNWNVGVPAAQFSPAFIYNQIAKGNCGSGITIPSALNLLNAEGAATLSMMPYTDQACAGQPTTQTVQMAAQFKISGYRTINAQDLNTVKAHLAAQMPVIVAMNIDNAFMNLGANQNWTTSGPVVGSHSMVVVGYNDTQHALKLINSWGTGWGTGGYGYVDYSLFPSVAKEAYVILPFYSAAQPTQTLEANVQLLSLVIVGGTTPGLNAQIEYTLRGYSGHTALIVLYFWYTNGQPVGAAIPGLADIAGNAAIATGTFAIQNNDYTNYTITQFIPTADLNVPMGPNVISNGQLVHEQVITPLLVKAELFVDNYGMAQSQYFTFSVAR